MKVSICAIIKNEQLFLKEWIDWHLSLGFDSIYLCEDMGSESHDSIISSYNNVSLVKYNESLDLYGAKYGSVHQENLYRYFLDVNPTDCDWCAFIDIDEFIHIDDGLGIKELLDDYEGCNGLYLYWRFYGADGHILRPSGNVQDNYVTECDFESDNGWRFKSIVNLNKCREMVSVHQVKDGVNTHGLQTCRVKDYYRAHIKHYFTKSWEDWICRFHLKGDLSFNHRKIEQFFDVNKDMEKYKSDLLNHFYEKFHKERYDVHYISSPREELDVAYKKVTNTHSIPKIIHRVWISDELPDPKTEVGRCFYSQEKLRDYGYEIRTYTANNFDFSISKYLLQAYSLKKWAFVADYIRLWALYNFGGIYLDADVEVIRDFDELLDCKYFWGAKYIAWDGNHCPNNLISRGLHHGNEFLFDCGVLGCEKGNYMMKLFYDYYNTYNFIERNGYIHDKNYMTPRYMEDYIEYKLNNILCEHNYKKVGFVKSINEYKGMVNSSDESKEVYVLASEFFGDYYYKEHMVSNPNCICIHYGAGTWIDKSNTSNPPIFLCDYSKERQSEYLATYNANKVSDLGDNVYILSNNVSIDIKDDFIVDDSKIVSNVECLDGKEDIIIINYDSIKNMRLFKYLLKNLETNCITSDYIAKDIVIDRNNLLELVKNNLLVKI